MSQTRRVTIKIALLAVIAIGALSVLRMNGPADAGSPNAPLTPSEAPRTTTYNILSTGDDGQSGQVGDVIRLPPGVDTEEETLAYLKSLGNPSPSPTPSTWSASNPITPDLSIIASLDSRGVDLEEFLREFQKGEVSAQELIERLATK